jgi:hypothetical protein
VGLQLLIVFAEAFASEVSNSLSYFLVLIIDLLHLIVLVFKVNRKLGHILNSVDELLHKSRDNLLALLRSEVVLAPGQ